MRDRSVDAALRRDGFVVLPGAARSIIETIRSVHRSCFAGSPPGFYSTLYSPDTAHKQQVHAQLVEALTPLLDELLEGYRPLLANFVTKARGGENGVMPAHQDWTFVDETAGSSLNVWIPLVDVDHRNGNLSVLPRSHRLPPTIRGTGTTNPLQEIDDEVGRRMVDLPMAAGDVLVHDHRLVHGSPANRRRRPRIAVACAVIAHDAELVHYEQGERGSLRRYRIEDSFFVRHTFGADSFPDDVVLTSELEFVNPTFGEPHLAALDGAAAHGGAA